MEEALAPGKAKEHRADGIGASNAAGTGTIVDWPPTTMPDRAGEERLRRLRQELNGILDAHRTRQGTDPPGTLGLLDAALLAARTELLTGGARLDRVIADFTYLMVLPMAGRRAAERAQAEVSARLATAADLL